MSNYYYPEGPLGPICDVVGDDAPKKKIIFDEGDGREYTYGPLEFPDMEAVMLFPLLLVVGVRKEHFRTELLNIMTVKIHF